MASYDFMCPKCFRRLNNMSGLTRHLSHCRKDIQNKRPLSADDEQLHQSYKRHALSPGANNASGDVASEGTAQSTSVYSIER